MESSELNASEIRLVNALQVLTSDVQMVATLSQCADTQFMRRTYVRAVFAQIEGNLNLMADLILEGTSKNP